MPINLLFRKAEPGQIGEVELDARLSENHRFRSIVTRHPIESGGKVSDHIINEPEDITMTGFITNSPVRIGGKIGQSIVDSLSSDQNSGDDKVQEAFTTLTSLRDEKIPFTVVTGLKVYRNLVFSSLEFPIDNRTGDSLRFISTMTRIPIVSSQTVPVENLADPTKDATQGTKDTASDNINRDKQTTEKATAEQERTASFAFKAAKAGKSSFDEIATSINQLLK